MKKRSKILLYILLQVFVLTACASKKENNAAASDTEITVPKETSTPLQAEDMPEIVKQENVRFIADDFTQEEMDFFTEFLNSTENNGFLASEYTTVTDANLNEVFYNGAGVSAHSLTAEEEAAYEEATGWEIYTDVERLTTEEIDRFLLRKTGYSYAEMNTPLEWTYLEQYDVYVSDHGDTNWIEYRCTGGRAQENLYEVYYEAAYYEDSENGGVLTLKKNGDDYFIVSNQRKQ
mgnify:CR=1 FL=1